MLNSVYSTKKETIKIKFRDLLSALIIVRCDYVHDEQLLKFKQAKNRRSETKIQVLYNISLCMVVESMRYFYKK